MAQSRHSTDLSADLIVVFLLSFALLITSAIRGVFIAYPLLVALALLIAALLNRGFSLQSLLKMGLAGIHQSLPVVQVLLLIGAVSAIWMAAGTVPALVYYGTGLMSGKFFLLWAFLLTSAVSVLTGTAFGAAGTIGVALMVIARSSNTALETAVEMAVEPVAGAIIAGAFLGDRCSPMSSSAHLVASITHTDLYTNLRNMIISGLWPLVISVAFYTVLSLLNPVQLAAAPINAALSDTFDLSGGVLLPAAAMFLLAILRVDVKLAMPVSIGLGVAIALGLQGCSPYGLLRFTLSGYQLPPDNPLQAILRGGGLLPMAKATLVVLISTAFAGIFSGSHVLSFVDVWLQGIQTRERRSQATLVVSTFANCFGCSQTIAILLTAQIMQPYYQLNRQPDHQPDYPSDCQLSSQQIALQQAHSRQQLALTLEDTAVVIAPLIPWNIASLIPAAVLGVGPGFIPYTVYLLLLPLFSLRPLPHTHLPHTHLPHIHLPRSHLPHAHLPPSANPPPGIEILLGQATRENYPNDRPIIYAPSSMPMGTRGQNVQSAIVFVIIVRLNLLSLLLSLNQSSV